MMFGRKKKDNNPAEEMEQVVAEQGQEDNDFGPFDGDTVNFEDFDFSDFSAGALDLGSMVIPVPRGGGVIVEMGPEGPQMIHLQVDSGRLTPVAFAAPRNGDLWAETIDETVAGMTKDGLEVHLEDGPWGQEICAVAGEGQMRIIGANGPRWMFRMTLAGEKSKAEDLALIAREIVARTFIRRGNDPIPAGHALPVLMPPPLQEQMEQQLRQMEAEQNGGEQQ
ncbi:DUF3710 domain-containing protein [Corynebacterium macclintockiae]|uniref:DUF3710 domain-containing protein n=1 Tax=Corynebacterium macclintockiae TaxID=2913501 RepID=UPI003EBDAC09